MPVQDGRRMEHGQGVVAVNVIGRALDVMGHTSIAYASHLHDSVYTHIVARARTREQRMLHGCNADADAVHCSAVRLQCIVPLS